MYFPEQYDNWEWINWSQIVNIDVYTLHVWLQPLEHSVVTETSTIFYITYMIQIVQFTMFAELLYYSNSHLF